MNEPDRFFKKQEQWQKGRKDLSWSEKIRLAEQIRESVEKWRQKIRKGHDTKRS